MSSSSNVYWFVACGKSQINAKCTLTGTDQLDFLLSKGLKPLSVIAIIENLKGCWKDLHSNRCSAGLFCVFLWKRKVKEVFRRQENVSTKGRIFSEGYMMAMSQKFPPQ